MDVEFEENDEDGELVDESYPTQLKAFRENVEDAETSFDTYTVFAGAILPTEILNKKFDNAVICERISDSLMLSTVMALSRIFDNGSRFNLGKLTKKCGVTDGDRGLAEGIKNVRRAHRVEFLTWRNKRLAHTEYVGNGVMSWAIIVDDLVLTGIIEDLGSIMRELWLLEFGEKLKPFRNATALDAIRLLSGESKTYGAERAADRYRTLSVLTDEREDYL